MLLGGRLPRVACGSRETHDELGAVISVRMVLYVEALHLFHSRMNATVIWWWALASGCILTIAVIPYS